MQELGPRQLQLIEDLETTTAEQSQGWLTRFINMVEHYCCLGRACVVVKTPRIRKEHYFMYGVNASTSCAGTLPKDVVEYFGFYSDCGKHKKGGGYESRNENPSMVYMNDILRLSFKDIAARLRAEPENYFVEPR